MSTVQIQIQGVTISTMKEAKQIYRVILGCFPKGWVGNLDLYLRIYSWLVLYGKDTLEIVAVCMLDILTLCWCRGLELYTYPKDGVPISRLRCPILELEVANARLWQGWLEFKLAVGVAKDQAEIGVGGWPRLGLGWPRLGLGPTALTMINPSGQ